MPPKWRPVASVAVAKLDRKWRLLPCPCRNPYAYSAGSVLLLDGKLPLRYAMFRVDRNKAVSPENDNLGIHRDKAAELIAQMRVGTKVLTEYSEWMNPGVKLNEFRLEGIGKALDECIAFVR